MGPEDAPSPVFISFSASVNSFLMGLPKRCLEKSGGGLVACPIPSITILIIPKVLCGLVPFHHHHHRHDHDHHHLCSVFLFSSTFYRVSEIIITSNNVLSSCQLLVGQSFRYLFLSFVAATYSLVGKGAQFQPFTGRCFRECWQNQIHHQNMNGGNHSLDKMCALQN